MKCPVCDESMREIEKHGVNLDICPACKGVWLDRGELEKILEMASSGGPDMDHRRCSRSVEQPYSSRNEHREHENEHRGSDDHDDHDSHGPRGDYERGQGERKKRGSWLGDILGGLGGD